MPQHLRLSTPIVAYLIHHSSYPVLNLEPSIFLIDQYRVGGHVNGRMECTVNDSAHCLLYIDSPRAIVAVVDRGHTRRRVHIAVA